MKAISLGRRLARRFEYGVGRRYHNLEAARYDRRLGIDTAGKASMKEMGLAGDLAEHGTGFQSVNERHLGKVLAELALPTEAGFVDIGCGKGKPLFIAADYGFARVVGVDVVPELCDVARRNAELLGITDVVTVECVSGTEYDFGKERVVFLNNPFDADFFRQMLLRLNDVAAADDRPWWVLYGNPNWMSVFEEAGGWSMIRHFSYWGPGRDIVAYRFVR